MGRKVFNSIVDEIKLAKYFSISIDSTPDVAHVDQLTVVIRYVLKEGLVEQFLKFIPMYSHTGEKMAKIVLKFLDDIDIKYCCGQSYDNAANTSGKYRCLQTLSREKCEVTHFVPCTAHSLNLIGKNAVGSCRSAAELFDLLQTTVFTRFTA